MLRSRAKIIARIRQFFADREVYEVDTPLLAHATVTDPFVIGIQAIHQNNILFLQTSPEYAMKRLLADGSGSIYQISKAFRHGDIGNLHHPEFTLLEWYRIGFDHHALMDETDELLQSILNTLPAERFSCATVYEKFLGIDCHQATIEELIACVNKNIDVKLDRFDRNTCLELLFKHCIEMHIGHECPMFLYDYPISQAALAKIRPGNPPVASRFEVYFKGIELANGFHELQDASVQRKRFEEDLAYRAQHGMPPVAIDEKFLAALEKGLPDCAGVALGVDRLVMLALGCDSIGDVMVL